MFRPNSSTIVIDGHKTPIDPDFRIMCDYAQAAGVKDKEALARAVGAFYCYGLPEGVGNEAAVKAMEKFYIDGLAPNSSGKSSAISKTSAPCFDFEEDEAYFIAAFYSEYGIDLTEAKLHWLTFCALFRGLPDECKLKRIISVRAVSLSDIKSASEKSRIRKLKGVFALKHTAKPKFRSIAERDEAARLEMLARFEEVKRLMEEGEKN